MAFTERAEARNSSTVFAWLRSIGLDAIELQMTYGPRMRPSVCHEYRQLALEFGIRRLDGRFIVISETLNSQERGAMRLRDLYVEGSRSAQAPHDMAP
ncbi:MAG: hypothetical protein R3D32_13425 [Nitratireductor sp.]